jgi:hypothetical protein
MGDDLEYISHVKKQLRKKFKMSDLGPVSYFLGIEVSHSTKRYYICQSKYIQDLIVSSRITHNRMATTPMDLHL